MKYFKLNENLYKLSFKGLKKAIGESSLDIEDKQIILNEIYKKRLKYRVLNVLVVFPIILLTILYLLEVIPNNKFTTIILFPLAISTGYIIDFVSIKMSLKPLIIINSYRKKYSLELFVLEN